MDTMVRPALPSQQVGLRISHNHRNQVGRFIQLGVYHFDPFADTFSIGATFGNKTVDLLAKLDKKHF